MLEAMDGGVGQIDAAVRLNHANVIGGYIAVNARGVHAFNELGVIDGEACDLFEFHRSSFAKVRRNVS